MFINGVLLSYRIYYYGISLTSHITNPAIMAS